MEEDGWIDDVLKDFENAECKTDVYITEVVKKETVEAEERREEKFREERRSIIKVMEIENERKKAKFQEAYNSLDRLIQVETEVEYSLNAVTDAVQRLQACRIDVEGVHGEIVKLTIKEGKEASVEESEWISDTEKTYNKLCDAAKVFCSKHKVPEKTREDSKRTGGGIRLDKIKFETFKGDIRKYPCFKNEFKKHIKPHFADEEEAFVLKSYLDTNIREDVSTLGDDAKEIWKRLDHKYGDEGKLVDSIMSDVKNITKCNDDCPTEIIAMIVTIERAHRDLFFLRMEQEISNSTIVSIIEQRLPKSIEDDWLDVVTGENRISVGRDKFPQLLKLLLRHKERLEYKLSDVRSTELKTVGVHAADVRSGRRALCWIHTESDHPIWRCKSFERKSIEEKLDLIRKNKACCKCLESDHESRECNKNFKCRKNGCGGPHHSLIHEAVERGMTLHGTQSGTTMSKWTIPLLLLQKITAKHNSQNVKKYVINCLWDSGSTLSFITFAMAKTLNLKGSKIHLNITKIGGVTEEIISNKYRLMLVNEQGKILPVTVLGLERISTQIQIVRLDEMVAQFKHLNLDDVRRPTRGEVDCLMGMDVAGFHPIRVDAVDHLILLKMSLA